MPYPIEEAISMNNLISQVALCGTNHQYSVVLSVPNFTIARSHLSLPDNNNDNRIDDILEEDIVNFLYFKLLINTEMSNLHQRDNLKI